MEVFRFAWGQQHLDARLQRRFSTFLPYSPFIQSCEKARRIGPQKARHQTNVEIAPSQRPKVLDKMLVFVSRVTRWDRRKARLANYSFVSAGVIGKRKLDSYLS